MVAVSDDLKEQLSASGEYLHRTSLARIEELEAETRTLRNYGVTADARIEELERERDEANDNAKQWAKDYAGAWNSAIEAAAKVAENSSYYPQEGVTIATDLRLLKRQGESNDER